VSAPDQLAARVFLRPIGTPLTLGMAGLAVGSFVDSGLELRWVVPSQALEIGLVLVSVPFILQVVACVFSYLARDGAAGTSLGVLATSWLGLGLVHIIGTPGHVSGALGLMLLASGGTVALSAVAVARAKPLPALVFACAAVRFGMAGIYQLSAASAWGRVSGVIGLVITALAGYCVIAFELEGQNRAPVLPTLRRGPGTSALHLGAAAQLDGVEHEPGVRQTT
jgi:succinate-acetate transporter protein